ncbi:hypothetical protein DY000_02056332 [Brassica cretica]|uniref:Leucine-rich repeat-containing N-terminal plant-type domain-containing protein n=1 Tax=Brassica cretica TaxID=69181 RepID=A0ABQ7AG79_BRACR|nr:hypothetical protein DY000_02056332 [Brassica cretica]
MHSLRKMIIWSSCLIFSLSYSILVFASSPAKHMCRPDQRHALWEFKNEFHFSGMAPNEKTQSSLNGSLRSNSGLFKLQHLQSLNLSSNNLAGILPDSIGNLKHLRVLKLNGCGFFGKKDSFFDRESFSSHSS